MEFHYDSLGRRLNKKAAQEVFYRCGVFHPIADRTQGFTLAHGHPHTLVECTNEGSLAEKVAQVFVFTPAGQTLLRILGHSDCHARLGWNHQRSVRSQVSGCQACEITVAFYGAYGEALVFGGILRQGFAGYEPDAESWLYNAGRRLYSPQSGIFASVDPQFQSPSPYAYCSGDPFNRVDSDGSASLNPSDISSIAGAIVLLVAIVATIATWGAAAPALLPASAGEAGAAAATGIPLASGIVGSGSVAAGFYSAAYANDVLAAAGEALSAIPETAIGFGYVGALLGAGTVLLQNGAGLIAKAAKGQHVSAWQAVKAMLVEPLVAGLAGGIGGSFGGIGIVFFGGQTAAMTGLVLAGALASTLFNGTVYAAANGQLERRSTWSDMGIEMGEAVVTSLILMPYMRSLRKTKFIRKDQAKWIAVPHVKVSQSELDRAMRLASGNPDLGFSPQTPSPLPAGSQHLGGFVPLFIDD